MNQLQLATRHFAIARFCFRAAFVLSIIAIGLLSGIAFAQSPEAGAAAPAAATPMWLSLLLSAIPVVLGLLVAAHPLMRLSQYLATKHTGSKAANAGLTVVEHLSASADKYLEESEHDIAAIATDPAKRAAALSALVNRAKAEVPAAIADAATAFGSSFLEGKASAALDGAQAKAQALTAGGRSPS